jgi:hypothetical protein
VLATADVMVLALQVLPGEICKRLNAECNLPERGKEQSGAQPGARPSGVSTRWRGGGARGLRGKGG